MKERAFILDGYNGFSSWVNDRGYTGSDTDKVYTTWYAEDLENSNGEHVVTTLEEGQ